MNTLSANWLKNCLIWSRYCTERQLKNVAKAMMFLCLMACSQGPNWREINVGELGVTVWLPCKPNNASRQIPLNEGASAGEITITMVGCEKDGMQFTISYMDMESASKIQFGQESTAKKLSTGELRKPSNINTNPNSNANSKMNLDQWMSLWERASLNSLGVKVDKGSKGLEGDKVGERLKAWRIGQKDLSPQAQTIKVLSDSGLEAEYVWFGYQGTLYQVALYKQAPVKEEVAVKGTELWADTFFSSLQFK